MLGIANMTEISRHYTHSIYTDSHRFFTVFAPDDLVRRCGERGPGDPWTGTRAGTSHGGMPE